MKGVVAGLVALIAAVVVAPPARAEVIYPWCLTMVLGALDSTENCGFVSHDQCQMSVVGRDYCSVNLAYIAASGGKVTADQARRGPLPPIHR